MGRNFLLFLLIYSPSSCPSSRDKTQSLHYDLLKGLSSHVISLDILLPAVEWIQLKCEGSDKTFPIETRVQHKGVS